LVATKVFIDMSEFKKPIMVEGQMVAGWWRTVQGIGIARCIIWPPVPLGRVLTVKK
jgi:hypothetical protein